MFVVSEASYVPVTANECFVCGHRDILCEALHVYFGYTLIGEVTVGSQTLGSVIS